jgi:hypothetical protein
VGRPPSRKAARMTDPASPSAASRRCEPVHGSCGLLEGHAGQHDAWSGPWAEKRTLHEQHYGDHIGYACGFSGSHCWACGEPWPCRFSRGLAPAPLSARPQALADDEDWLRLVSLAIVAADRDPNREAWTVLRDAIRRHEPQADPLRAALERLLAVAMTEEEDQSSATQDEWIAAMKQANEALDALPQGPSMDHNTLRAAIVNIDPKMAGPFTISDLSQFTDALIAVLQAPQAETSDE